MGGAIGLIVAQSLYDLGAFVSVEGNLVAEDCGLVSRGIADQSPDAYGLHGLARSLVEWCDSEKLVNILASLAPTSYVHGEYSKVDYLTDRLGNMPMYSVSRSGHFPMLDNPDDFYALIRAILSRTPAVGPPIVSASTPV